MTIPVRVGPTQPAFSKQSSNLSMYMPKRVGDKGQPCLTLILQLISFDQPSVFLNLAIMFSYILIATSLKLERHFYLFQPIPKVFPRNHVKIFSKVNKATKKIGFSIA
jgi:hypothetical protein